MCISCLISKLIRVSGGSVAVVRISYCRQKARQHYTSRWSNVPECSPGIRSVVAFVRWALLTSVFARTCTWAYLIYCVGSSSGHHVQVRLCDHRRLRNHWPSICDSVRIPRCRPCSRSQCFPGSRWPQLQSFRLPNAQAFGCLATSGKAAAQPVLSQPASWSISSFPG